MSAGRSTPCCNLLYARFWHKVLFDRGYVGTPEPFKKLVNQGMILGEMEFTGYQAGGRWVSAAEVAADAEGNLVLKKTGDCPDFCGTTPQKWDCPLGRPRSRSSR